MVESLHVQTGLMLSVHNPLIIDGAWRFNLLDELNSWSHTSAADGGYLNARTGISGPQLELEDWIENGLGRHVVLYGPELTPAWEGFVNTVNLTLGGLAYKVGPLINVANYAFAVYSTVDTTVDPPAVGMRATTPATQIDSSVAKYGQLERVISVGGCTAANALQIRDMFLLENSLPEASQSITPGGGNTPALTLELLGYNAWLNTYIYNNVTTGTVTVYNRIVDVMTTSPSLVYSTDYGQMDANATAIPAYENDDKKAYDVIKGAVALGDPTDFARYTFGVYDDRQAYYKKMPTAVEYVYRLSSGSQAIETTGGARVQPWNVRPAKWLEIPDFLIGRAAGDGNLRDDPRNVFIESVTYTAPFGLTINGGKVSTLKQKMAQLGLGGAG
jgi:hypothetical protein